MLRCSHCGHENRTDDRFCANCGAGLEEQVNDASAEVTKEESRELELPTGIPPQFTAPQTPEREPELPRNLPQQFEAPTPREPFAETPSPPGEVNPGNEDWRMSSLGPPPRPRRRLWLWIVLGLLGLCLLSCVGFLWWSTNTGSGEQFWDDVWNTATAQAED